MEVVFAAWAVGVLLILISIHRAVTESVAWSRRLHERSVEQLIFFLFRTPTPSATERQQKIDSIILGLSSSVGGPEQVAIDSALPESRDGHPMVTLARQIGQDAYKAAEDVTLSHGHFDELGEDEKERFRQVFWEHFSFKLGLLLPGKAWLIEGMRAEDESEGA